MKFYLKLPHKLYKNLSPHLILGQDGSPLYLFMLVREEDSCVPFGNAVCKYS